MRTHSRCTEAMHWVAGNVGGGMGYGWMIWVLVLSFITPAAAEEGFSATPAA